MTETIKHHKDGGHGWLFISYPLMKKYGLSKDSFSSFSYFNDKGVYAEEDCDAQIIIKAIKEAGKRIVFKGKHTNGQSEIRGLERC